MKNKPNEEPTLDLQVIGHIDDARLEVLAELLVTLALAEKEEEAAKESTAK